MTQIALNARFYSHRPTGMQRYAIEMSQRFADHLHPVRPAAALCGPPGHVWEQLYLPAAVRGRMLWSPNNTGPLAVSRQVCTIHDLIPIDHPEWFNRRFAAWYAWLLPRLVKRVQHIIAISEFTKHRLVERFRVPEAKVTVVYNGINSSYRPAPAEEVEAMRRAQGLGDSPYLLYVGSLEPRKNLSRLLRAWSVAQESITRGIQLVVAGARASSRVFGDVAIEGTVPNTRFTGYVPEEQLPALYSGALVVVYPSLYEGFGLPPLEAMACGTPVVTSNNTSLPEVVGNSAVLVDPENVDSIAAGMVEVASSAPLRASLSRMGTERAESFTWERAAHRTLQVLLNQVRG
jgi:glycosyltransferase involved in cell wall biosynthesis